MPQVILLFSGKRKSGKDFITTHLQKLLGDRCEVLKISQPIKSHWAKEKNLNLNELLGDGFYKEQYRLDMINWSEKMRAKDYGYFCKIATDNALEKPIWIVSDIRRKTDIRWFNETYGNLIRNIRIYADDETRDNRGYEFKSGVDDVASECDLDDYNEWDLVIDNSNGKQDIEDQLSSIIRLVANS
ncbi:phosphomevalonate kinase-like [Trichoplusia ni]|uniref:Phosphomevalonate kinase n=1 Tax=Trichoplusia ni TaxID=7111 RepID=A0A7E5WKP9_TRINI|nr:phosphomevalonate kinase-like [Trichoplusia ni]XP_026741303.1 phosphomevalonate kinase-like [Trichoplusia ni]